MKCPLPFRLCVTALAGLLLLPLGVVPTRANDLSESPCTAGDVEIVGDGIIINEPCVVPASGLFNATVRFTVRNNTSTGRYCISLHLVPDGAVIATPIDVVLRDANGGSTAPGKSGGQRYRDTVMFGTIANYPASAGVVCFGQAGVVRGKCAPNACTTVAWSTSPGAAGCELPDQNPPGGQCRHQQVCIVGFGATLACVSNCNALCGSAATLRACVEGPADKGPFQMALVGSDGSSYQQSTYVDATGGKCVEFTVNPTQSPTTTYTLTVTDRAGCTRVDTASVSVTSVTPTITAPTSSSCNGVLSYTASVSGWSGCTFTWTVDGVAYGTFATGGNADDARVARVKGAGNSTFEFRALDNACHTIGVRSSCASGTQTPCSGTASVTVKQCASPTFGCNP